MLWELHGNVTGIHLHLELSTGLAWDYDTFLNPSTALGIPNERGTIVKYDGSAPPPIPPTPSSSGKAKRWYMSLNKKIKIIY